MEIWEFEPMTNRAIASVGAHTNVLRMDETETVVLCVCLTMSQEDMIFSHVCINVYVVSLIINYSVSSSLKAFTQA